MDTDKLYENVSSGDDVTNAEAGLKASHEMGDNTNSREDDKNKDWGVPVPLKLHMDRQKDENHEHKKQKRDACTHSETEGAEEDGSSDCNATSFANNDDRQGSSDDNVLNDVDNSGSADEQDSGRTNWIVTI